MSEDIWAKLSALGARLLDVETYSFWPDRLASNLAIAAALCRSFSLGHVRGMFRPSIDDSREIIDEYERTVWRPGTGMPAPKQRSAP